MPTILEIPAAPAGHPSPSSLADARALDECRAFIMHQQRAGRLSLEAAAARPSGPAITLAHASGANAHAIAAELAGLLQTLEPPEAAAWTMFDRRLLERIGRDRRLAEFLPPLFCSPGRDGAPKSPDPTSARATIQPQVAAMFRHLARIGHVILLDEDARTFTRDLAHVFHVRLVTSSPTRIHEPRSRSPEPGRETDASLRDDPVFDLTLNTDHIPSEDAASLIAQAAQHRFITG